MKCKFCNSKDVVIKDCPRKPIVRSPFLMNFIKYENDKMCRIYECQDCGRTTREDF